MSHPFLALHAILTDHVPEIGQDLVVDGFGIHWQAALLPGTLYGRAIDL